MVSQFILFVVILHFFFLIWYKYNDSGMQSNVYWQKENSTQFQFCGRILRKIITLLFVVCCIVLFLILFFNFQIFSDFKKVYFLFLFLFLFFRCKFYSFFICIVWSGINFSMFLFIVCLQTSAIKDESIRF